MPEERKHALTLGELYNELGDLIVNDLSINKDTPITVSRVGHGDFSITGAASFQNKIRLTTEISPKENEK